MLDDHRLIHLRRTFENRPARVVPRTGAIREAAVALILRPRERLELLLIHRAELVGDPWSGHVALPGGRREPADPDLFATALREAEEEVGIPLHRVGSLIGSLDELTPSTPRLPPIAIAPFVLAVPPETATTPNPAEVQAALWVPVDALRETNALSEILIEHAGQQLTLPSIVFGEHVIWGLTYRIIQQFLAAAG